ncbi:NADH-quinone oxidoreductase subunit C [Kineosporia sp. J2-2]|uniref:NADH-quinone oxidoreductase subunit C n=1 Tax=Kineosporia corallincola TaxID=2835133 RepID=A0ABS5T9P8_9ACTN|nr:NADH-quinone oxidoreductase subunit C [Kineosporia corallincola]MBT0767796.1 NADH-quinone oxidoreductase subunit C [Kineosporia corallincola]
MNPGTTPDARQLEAWFSAALRPADPPVAGTLTGTVTVSADAAGVPVVDIPAAGWVAAATCARDEMGLDFLDWLSAVDEPEGDPAGLDVVLHLAATDSFGTPARSVRRMMLRTRVPDTALELPSLTGLWPGVAWHERETSEMFGLDFTGFDDRTGAGLRPLLLPDGFEGTPLRKSFVLAARAAKAWPGAKDPGDSGRAPTRRKTLPPGVPDPSWGPREPGAPPASAAPEATTARGGAKVTRTPEVTTAPEPATPAPGDATEATGAPDSPPTSTPETPTPETPAQPDRPGRTR